MDTARLFADLFGDVLRFHWGCLDAATLGWGRFWKGNSIRKVRSYRVFGCSDNPGGVLAGSLGSSFGVETARR